MEKRKRGKVDKSNTGTFNNGRVEKWKSKYRGNGKDGYAMKNWINGKVANEQRLKMAKRKSLTNGKVYTEHATVGL